MSRIVKPVEERRQEILASARRHFTANGYKNTSVADIAGDLGIAQGLVFHYFKSKSALLYEVFDEIAAEEQANLRAAFAQHPGKAIDCLELVFNQQHSHRDYERLADDLHDDPAIREYLEGRMTAWISPLVSELIGRGNADGSWDCDYPDETAVFIIWGIGGIIRSTKQHEMMQMAQATRAVLLRVLGVSDVVEKAGRPAAGGPS
jgi:AcrR family transcriptional regulator